MHFLLALTLIFIADGSDTFIHPFGMDLAALVNTEITQIDESDLVFV